MPNSAFYFAGNGERISIPPSDSLDLVNGYTLAAWIKFEVGGGPNPRIIDKFTYTFLTSGNGAQRPLEMHFSDQLPFLTSAMVLNTGQWYHVASSYDLQQRRLYVNGNLVASDYYTWTIQRNSLPLKIGRKPSYGYDGFKGIIDDVHIYNRALSATEVAQLYSGGYGPVSLSNVRASQRTGTKLVDIFYDLANPQGNALTVSVAVSTNNGTSFNLSATSFTPANGSSTTPGDNRQVTWNAGADWNNHLSSQVKFRITAAGTLTADSSAITVDTQDGTPANPIAGNRPVVQDVSSAYCSAIQHAYFLNGVSLSQAFTANVNWNGKTAGSIKFVSPGGTRTGATQTYNVGTDFGVGGTLMVKAVASDGTESPPKYVKFDVINPPPDVSALNLYAVPFTQGLKYTTGETSWLNSKPIFNLITTPTTVRLKKRRC